MTLFSSSVLGGVLLGTTPLLGAIYTSSAVVEVSGYTVTAYTTPVYVIGNAVVTFTIPLISTNIGQVVTSGDANVVVSGYTVYATVGNVSATTDTPIIVPPIPGVSSSTGTPYVIGDANIFVTGATVVASAGRITIRKEVIKLLDSGEGISGYEYEKQYKKRRDAIGRNYTVYVKGITARTSAGVVTVKVGRKPIKLVRESITLSNTPTDTKVIVVTPTTITRKPIELITALTKKRSIKRTPIKLKSNISIRPPISVVTKSKSTVKLHKQPIKLMENEGPQAIRLKRIPIHMISPDVLDDGEMKHSHK